MIIHSNSLIRLWKKIKNKKVLCIPEAGDSWMRSFLRVVLDSENIDTSELMVKNVGPVDPLVSVEKFNKMVRKCKKGLLLYQFN